MILIKMAGDVLVPACENTRDRLSKVAVGQIIRGDYKKARNSQFHRKFWVLLDHAYDCWEPGEMETRWGIPAKDPEKFRKELTILAGFYDVVHSIDGTFRLEPKSISFSNMDQDEFERVYSKVVDVILGKILTSYSREDLDEVVDRILRMT
jgi:hypothetical protein